MENRRNYYRILQVQPEAPAAVIKATYRTLMQTLRGHPDLGGDEWNASLLNQAYQILLNPDSRKAYDQSLLEAAYQRKSGAGSPPVSGISSNTQHNALLTGTTLSQASAPDIFPISEPERAKLLEQACFFCKTLYWDNSEKSEKFCMDCDSPLKGLTQEERTSRLFSRLEKQEEGHFYTYWPQKPKRGLLLDVSPAGIGFLCKDWIMNGAVIKVTFPFVRGIAEIKRVEFKTEYDCFQVGAILLTADFTSSSGSFLSLHL